MKKVLAMLIAAVMLLSLPASAAINWETIDEENNIVSISGDAETGKLVTVIILRDGYAWDDFISSDASVRHAATVYYGYDIADATGYKISGLTITEGGEFDVYANGEELIDYSYYPSNVKRDAITEFNRDASDANTNYLLKVFQLSQDVLVKGNSGYLTEVKALKGSLSTADLETAKDELVKALILSAFNNKKSDLVLNGYEFIYPEELGLENDSGVKVPEYADYMASNVLNTEGKNAVKSAVMAKTYTDISKVKEAFCEALYVNIIMKNYKSGYGHIQGAFEKYDTAYEAAGITIPAREDIDLYISLLESGANSLSEIKYALENPTYNTGSGSSGGGGGGGGVNPPSSFVPPSSGTTTPQVPTNPVTPPANTGSYTDLPDSHWASDAFEALSKADVINGYTDGSVKPEAEVTRAEFAKMLVSLLGLDISDINTGFSDVPSTDWSAPYIAAAAKAGLITGNNGGFNPTDIISRQDAAIILARAAKLSASAESTFTDNDKIADYAKDAAAAVQEAGLMQGTGDGSFNPLGSMTRAQAAMVLYRLSQKGAN